MEAAAATEASLNLAPLIAPDTFHRSRVVLCLLTGEKGSVWGGKKARDIILNGWGWSVGGLNGVICRGIYSSDCHGDSPPLLTDWLPTSSSFFFQRGRVEGETKRYYEGLTKRDFRGVLHRLLSLWSVICSSLFIRRVKCTLPWVEGSRGTSMLGAPAAKTTPMPSISSRCLPSYPRGDVIATRADTRPLRDTYINSVSGKKNVFSPSGPTGFSGVNSSPKVFAAAAPCSTVLSPAHLSWFQGRSRCIKHLGLDMSKHTSFMT